MPVLKRGLTLFPTSFNLNAQSVVQLALASAGAAVANTTVQVPVFVSPYNYKINKIAIAYTAVAAVTGTHKLNLVVGLTGAYTAGKIAANDNSIAGPSVGPGTTYPTSPGGMGYPTNVGVIGNSVFSADLAILSTNVFNPAGAANINPPNGTAGMSVLGTGWQLVGTGGGYGLFVPDAYDAVYPAGIPLTLRLVTPASTGSITALSITIGYEPIALRGAPMSTAGQVISLPGTDF